MLNILSGKNINVVLRISGIFFLYGALFSGRYSLERLVFETSRNEWLGLRFWFAAFAAFSWLLLAKRDDLYKRKSCKHILIIVTLLAMMYGYFIFNQIFVGNNEIRMKYLVDVLMILVDLFLILNLIKTEEDIVIFAGIAEGIGVLLFVFCLLGFGRPELSGPGWAPFGGPFTFYHIEFLTFCGALYLSRKSPVKRIRVVHLIIAAIGLFSSYSSLSKAAFVGIFAVTLYYMFWLFSIRKVKHAIGIGALVISVFTFFYLIQGKIVKARVAEFEGVGAGGFDPGNLLERMLPGISIYDDLRWDALTIDQRNKLINMVELFDLKWFPPYTKENLERLKEFINRVVIQYDASVRVRLILHAWKLFKSDRWFGAGIGNYLVEAINMYTKRVEKYIYPHNILLEIAASTGLLGLTIFSAALLISLAMFQRLLLGDENILYFSGYQIFMLVTAQFSGDAFDFRLFWFITLILISSHQNVLRTFILEKR